MTQHLHFLGYPPHILPAGQLQLQLHDNHPVGCGGERGVGGIGGGVVGEDGVEVG